MTDKFRDSTDTVIAPAREAFAITPDNTAALVRLPKAIRVGTGGDLVLRAIDSVADVTLKNCLAGEVIAVRAQFVRANGTTASDLVGFA
jgi:hypothetical protein